MTNAIYPTLRVIVHKLCLLLESQHFCDYFVINIGNNLRKYKLNFFYKTNWLCTKIFKVCPFEYKKLVISEFREELNKRFP